MGRKAVITGVGHYVPEKVLSNADLEKFMDTNDEWIVTRTGIRERRIAADGEASSAMAFKAVEMLFADRNDDMSEVDLIVLATVTPDMFFPSTSCLLQHKIGAKNAWAMDISAACSGFVYSLVTGVQFIETGRYKKVLVVGVDTMSSILDYDDRTTSILFGDGAGAVLLEPSDEEGYGYIDSILKSDGSGGDYLYMPGGGSLMPATVESVQQKKHFIRQDGKTVFKHAVKGMADVSDDLLKKVGLSGSDIRYFIPHQANQRIIEASARRMSLREDQVVINIDRYGNTTAATIPLALSEVYRERGIERGDYILIAAFGAGFTWGSALIRWAI